MQSFKGNKVEFVMLLSCSHGNPFNESPVSLYCQTSNPDLLLSLVTCHSATVILAVD